MIVRIDAVVADGRGDDFTRGEAGSVVNGHDADAVDRHGFSGRQLIFRGDERADDDGIESSDVVHLFLPADDCCQFLPPGHFKAVNAILGNDDEQGEIDGVNAFAEDHALPAALADRGLRGFGIAEEFTGVLEEIAVDDPAEGLAGRQRFAVPRIHISDFSLRNDDQRNLVDAILPPPVERMDSTAEQVGLISGFPAEGDDPAAADGPPGGPFFLDDSDAVIGDGSDAEEDGDEDKRRDGRYDPPKGRRNGRHIRQVRREGRGE